MLRCCFSIRKVFDIHCANQNLAWLCTAKSMAKLELVNLSYFFKYISLASVSYLILQQYQRSAVLNRKSPMFFLQLLIRAQFPVYEGGLGRKAVRLLR